MKKVLLVLLSIMMIAVVLVSCDANQTKGEGGSVEEPIAEEGKRYTKSFEEYLEARKKYCAVKFPDITFGTTEEEFVSEILGDYYFNYKFITNQYEEGIYSISKMGVPDKNSMDYTYGRAVVENGKFTITLNGVDMERINGIPNDDGTDDIFDIRFGNLTGTIESTIGESKYEGCKLLTKKADLTVKLSENNIFKINENIERNYRSN